MAEIAGVPEEIYNTIFNLFRNPPATLIRKKDSNGYLNFEDIINEPAVYPLTRKYGGIQGVSYYIFRLGILPRKNTYKFLELNPQQTRVRPVAHIFKLLKELEGSMATVRNEGTRPSLRANVAEYIPPSVMASRKEAEDDAAIDALFAKIENSNANKKLKKDYNVVKKIWNRGTLNPENNINNEPDLNDEPNLNINSVSPNRNTRKRKGRKNRKSRKN